MGKAIADFVGNDAIRGILALVLLCGTLALLFWEHDVPTVLWAMDASALSFYFGVTVGRNGTG